MPVKINYELFPSTTGDMGHTADYGESMKLKLENVLQSGAAGECDPDEDLDAAEDDAFGEEGLPDMAMSGAESNVAIEGPAGAVTDSGLEATVISEFDEPFGLDAVAGTEAEAAAGADAGEATEALKGLDDAEEALEIMEDSAETAEVLEDIGDVAEVLAFCLL